jgi:hypothetical protein
VKLRYGTDENRHDVDNVINLFQYRSHILAAVNLTSMLPCRNFQQCDDRSTGSSVICADVAIR